MNFKVQFNVKFKVEFRMKFTIRFKGSPQIKKTVKKGTLSPLGNPPPKRVKMGHLLSDYRQKCVNATRDILMSKTRKITTTTKILDPLD